MTIPVLEEFRRGVSPDSVWKIIFPGGYTQTGYPRFWGRRVLMVAGENGVVIAPPPLYGDQQEAPVVYKKLNGREVRPSDIHVGNDARITDMHGYKFAGIVTANSDDALQLATGFLTKNQHGYPTAHPHSAIAKYEILE